MQVDVFPVMEFSVDDVLRRGACQVGGLRMDAFAESGGPPDCFSESCSSNCCNDYEASQSRHIWYLHPGFSFFDMRVLFCA